MSRTERVFMTIGDVTPLNIKPGHSDISTFGNWSTEQESTAALDERLHAVDLWKVYREVRGTLLQPRAPQADKSVRIDRVLVPNDRLLDLGWNHGIIGIEAKRSGISIGPPISQAMDYSRAVWTLPTGSIKIWLDWVFIWPMTRQGGPIASILAQNRIGSAHCTNWTVLQLKSGESSLLYIGRNGDIRIGAGTNGQRTGTR